MELQNILTFSRQNGKFENEKQIDVDVEQSRNILNKYVDRGKNHMETLENWS